MSKTKTTKRTYILYDSRACGDQGTEDASVLEVCETNSQARQARGYGAMACYSYAREGKTLVDERWEWDFWDREEA